MTFRENTLDPQRWNRYAYVRNDPLRYIDPDGRKVRVARDGNNITLTLRVNFKVAPSGEGRGKGGGADPAFKAWFKDVAEKTWSGKFGEYNVTTRVQGGRDNTVYLVQGSAEVRAGAPDGSKAYDAITWGTPALNRGSTVPDADKDWAMSHEIGHLMYLGDGYEEDASTNPPTSRPKPGETDIMAVYGQGQPDERTIGRILDTKGRKPKQ